MKNKLPSIIMAVMACGISSSEAVTVFINNVSNGPSDTLWALNDNTLMSGGSVTIGYFAATTTVLDIDTIPELVSKLGEFTTIGAVTIGSLSPTLNLEVDGYAEGSPSGFSTTLILPIVTPSPGPNPLVGRTLYQIATDAAVVGTASITNQFALFNVGSIQGDDAGHQQVTTTSPADATQVFIGGNGTFDGDVSFGGGEGAYSTLQLAVAAPIPEPSTALLGALGALALLRRRRN